MITLDEYLMGRDVQYPITDVMRQYALETVKRANELLEIFGEPRSVRSGYRPAEINAVTPGAALHSKHMSCQAVDLEDNDQALSKWCLSHLQALASLGLWMEAPKYTPTWTHVQIIAPKSGNRVFIP